LACTVTNVQMPSACVCGTNILFWSFVHNKHIHRWRYTCIVLCFLQPWYQEGVGGQCHAPNPQERCTHTHTHTHAHIMLSKTCYFPSKNNSLIRKQTVYGIHVQRTCPSGWTGLGWTDDNLSKFNLFTHWCTRELS
jgi:hypothetical protein